MLVIIPVEKALVECVDALASGIEYPAGKFGLYRIRIARSPKAALDGLCGNLLSRVSSLNSSRVIDGALQIQCC